MPYENILVVGANGQLGWELQRTRPREVNVTALDLPDLDLADGPSTAEHVRKARPDLIVNAAAYTQVDRAEDDTELAYAINEKGVSHLVAAARPAGAFLLHVSTDFVFDGDKGAPYSPEDSPSPRSVYGASKRAGEEVLLRDYPEHGSIVRTAWLYSSHGQNFAKTMLRLFDEREELKVVSDQVGTPTWARHLALFLWTMIRSSRPMSGVHHFTDAGAASWYDFAVAIEEESRAWRGREVRILPVSTEEYPTRARRPSNSLLDKSAAWKRWSVEPVHWRKALRSMLEELRQFPEGR